MDYTPDGDLGDYTAADVADGVEWAGDPAELLAALRECGFVDGTTIHDWEDYGGKLHRKRQADAERKREERQAREQGKRGRPKPVQRTSNGRPADVPRMSQVEDIEDIEDIEDSTGQDREDLPKEDAAAVARAREDEERSSSIEDRTSNPEPKPEVPAYLTDDDDPMDALLLELWKVKGWRKAPKEDRAMLAQLGAAFPRADLATAIQQLRMKALDGAVETNLRSALQAFVKQLHLQTPEPREPVEPEPPPAPLTPEQIEDIRADMRAAQELARQASREMRV
jgi:hypothetical protein